MCKVTFTSRCFILCVIVINVVHHIFSVNAWGIGNRFLPRIQFRNRMREKRLRNLAANRRNAYKETSIITDARTGRSLDVRLPILNSLRRKRSHKKVQMRKQLLDPSASMSHATEQEKARTEPGIEIKDTTVISKIEKEILAATINYVNSELGEKKPSVEKGRKRRKKAPLAIVRNTEELRSAVLDRRILLEDIEFHTPSITQKVTSDTKEKVEETKAYNAVEDLPFDHEVLKVIQERFRTNSLPGARAFNDTAQLALSIEGGGMRGAVSAGMASAIACLGLCNCFDQIYGSSAGSIIGAYMVSRQMCIDVYTEVLTASKTAFVSKSRLISWIAGSLVDQAVGRTRLRSPQIADRIKPGMNTSFVLDSILCPEYGLRPLDFPMFKENDKLQPLRIVTSTVREGKMETVCLGSQENDFFDEIDESTGMITNYATTSMDGKRHGLFACLDASMTVPAAAGPPLHLVRTKDSKTNITSSCFDAFCFEPIPYRSAVKEGATHVLVLKSRPDGCPIGTKPGVYEKTISPLYFNSHNLPQATEFFKVGGQQYIYAEDYLTLDEGKNDKTGKGVLVPPAEVLYGAPTDEEKEKFIKNRSNWKKAHLLPVACPVGTPELSTLSLDKDEVLNAVRQGFSAAFDLLAPSVGISLNEHMNSTHIAELVFPSNINSIETVLERRIPTPGFTISSKGKHHVDIDLEENNEKKRRLNRVLRWVVHGRSVLKQRFRKKRKDADGPNNYNTEQLDENNDTEHPSDQLYFIPSGRSDAKDLLDSLPGLRTGKFSSISKGLQFTKGHV